MSRPYFVEASLSKKENKKVTDLCENGGKKERCTVHFIRLLHSSTMPNIIGPIHISHFHRTFFLFSSWLYHILPMPKFNP